VSIRCPNNIETQWKVIDTDFLYCDILPYNILEAYDEKVLVKEAYDEKVPITEKVSNWKCECGKQFDTLKVYEIHSDSYIDTEDNAKHDSYSVIKVSIVTGYDTVHHEAEYKTVHHDAEYDRSS